MGSPIALWTPASWPPALLVLVEHGSSTVVTSQLPVKKWHEWIGDPTVADAILDRLVHNAFKFELTGSSKRKTVTA